MLIKDRHSQFICQFPASLVITIARMRARTGSTHDNNFWMCFRHPFIHIFEPFNKLRRDTLLVTQSEVLQSERFRMTGLSADSSPFRIHIAISPLDQVESLVYPLVHFTHRNHILRLVSHAPTAICTLTTYSTRQDR